MTDSVAGGPLPVLTVAVGCEPMLEVEITETETGTLFIVVRSADPNMKPADIDGIFFDLADDSTLDALNFFPDANTGSIFSPVTSIQAAADSVDTLANGAQVADSYDVGIQFGTVDSSTQGAVPQANFTLWSDNGPLKISDLDTGSFAVVVDSDGGNGQVLTTGDAPDADPVLVSKEVLFDDFDDLHTPEQSAIIDTNTGWVAAYDKIVTNGHYDGTVTFTQVATDGPVTLSMDLSTHNTHVFENAGHYQDSLMVEVSIDGGDWVVLDTYQVNDAGTAIVGSETGQSFGTSGNNVLYEGGILDTAQESVQFRVTSDITANDEVIKIDNVSVTASELVDGGDMQPVDTVLLSEDFAALGDPAQSDAIVYDSQWDVQDGALRTDGHNDGVLKLAPVTADGDLAFSFDAQVQDASLFEASGSYRDVIKLQVQQGDGSWQTLDRFVVNNEGTALVGSETGNAITEEGASLSYAGGDLDDVQGEVQFRFISDISAGNEVVTFDNFEIVETSQVDTGGGDGADRITVDFEGLNAGEVVSDQFDGVTVSAQRAGDGEGSQNDAMIFDTDAPTGGDHDLAYDDQGNALIISEDNDGSDPDDNAHGGSLTFDFDAPSAVQSLEFLDIEEAGGVVSLFDANGDAISNFDIPVSGDNGQGTLDINVEGVSTMEVSLVGSGAVDNLVFTPPADGDGGDAGKGGQYDVEYIAGVPVLQEVDADKFGKATDDADADDGADDLLV
ncbi:hypothetical protein [Sulfitobacter sp. S190]|uniref:hypothetical protein n=1 Tax=Sulfitobacter sp. S190 TaxID=2867022 RepID=UPI0021A4A05A|nr:hypothetical protein [Sulfitobacter sp. S190]UWR23580.1 hypothetical protein K3756_06290 [Sulfitobacter sp. S190]